MKSLAAKILLVMQDVESVAKDKTNDFHKYSYASDAAVVTAAREAMIKHALVLIPSHLEEKREEKQDEKGWSYFTTLKVNYRLCDADSGEFFDSVSTGYGQDKGDKGIYKAATGAEKYYLTKTFLIPTEDDPERDGAKPRPQSRPAVQSAPRPPAAPEKTHLPTQVTDDIEGIVNDIKSKLVALNDGSEPLINDHLAKITQWTNKQTGEMKFLKISDLSSVAVRKPDWIKQIHKKVLTEYGTYMGGAQ